MNKVHRYASVLKVIGMVLALIGLFPAVPGVVQADVAPAPAGILTTGLHYNCGLKSSGAVECWGWNFYGQVLNQPGPYTQVAASQFHTCALTVQGAADCWGVNNPDYDTGQGVDQPGPYTYVGGGVWHTCGLTPLGAADCWGANRAENDFGQAADRPGPYVQLSVGFDHNCALKSDGAIECWGYNAYGQAVGQPGPYYQVSAGAFQTCGLTEHEAVDCWGDNGHGQAQDQPGPYVQVSAGQWHSCALRPDGAIDCWGWDYSGQVSGTAGENVSRFASHQGPYTRVSAGYFHTCGLTPNGAVECWGDPGWPKDRPGPYAPFDPRPAVTAQPQSQTVAIGDTAGLSAAAQGWPVPAMQWQVSTDGGASWADIDGAIASPLEFTASLDQSGAQYRAVFTNSEGSATSDAATLTVVKRTAEVTLADLSYTYDGQPKAAMIATNPPGLAVIVTYDGLADAPTAAGDHAVVAAVSDDTYEGSASGTLAIAPKAASVTPAVASKVYGDSDPSLSGTLAGFLEADGVTAVFGRTPGEEAGQYTISAALSPAAALDNYAITYNTAAFTIEPLAVEVTADAQSKRYGDPDPELTFTHSPELVAGDAFSGVLTRDAGEDIGVYAIRQGTLALSDNYALTFAGADLTITLNNTAPTANPGGPYLGAIDSAISFDGSGSSDPDGDALTYSWTFGDGGTASGALPAHSYAAAGIYNACLTVNDGTVSSDPACIIAVVYDPTGGFVTGGGWIHSPAGAYKPDLSLSGPATFGFVSRYHKGSTVPTGNTAFKLDAAGFSFDSGAYEWLVVNRSGTNAQFRGSGTVNGGLDPSGAPYKFMIWATDGAPDTLRIRIWWEAGGVETDVYDNGAAQTIGGGNIVVHSGK